MYPNIIYPLGYPKCDGCGYPIGAPIPLGAHKYCGDCYAKGTIKATARPLNSSEIEGLRRLLEERFGAERPDDRAALAGEAVMNRWYLAMLLVLIDHAIYVTARALS
jgi:hypothetical protein